jgi:hypothetical protein
MGDKMQEVKNGSFTLIIIPCIFYVTFFFTCDIRESMYDEEGNLLDEKPIGANEVERRKKITTVKNKVEDLIQRAKSSNEGLYFLVSNVTNIVFFRSNYI